MYFQNFPLVLYDMKGTRKETCYRYCKESKVRSKILDSASLYQKYFVVQGRDLKMLHLNTLVNQIYIGSSYLQIILQTHIMAMSYVTLKDI